MEGTRSVDPLQEGQPSGRSAFDGTFKVIYEALSDLNLQLPQGQRIETSPTTVLFGEGGKLDSLGLANFIVIAEQKLEEYFGFPIVLTEDDPFSPTTGHFRTVQSLAAYIAQSVARKRGEGIPSPL